MNTKSDIGRQASDIRSAGNPTSDRSLPAAAGPLTSDVETLRRLADARLFLPILAELDRCQAKIDKLKAAIRARSNAAPSANL